MACVNYRGTPWQGNGMGAAWHVWISLVCVTVGLLNTWEEERNMVRLRGWWAECLASISLHTFL
jgi:hypothetical protein